MAHPAPPRDPAQQTHDASAAFGATPIVRSAI